MGKGFADASVLVAVQVPFPAPVVGVLDVEDLVGEVAVRPTECSNLPSPRTECSDEKDQKLVPELQLGQALFDLYG